MSNLERLLIILNSASPKNTAAAEVRFLLLTTTTTTICVPGVNGGRQCPPAVDYANFTLFCFFSLAAAAFSPHLFFAVTVAAAADSSLLPPQQPLAGRQYNSVQYSTSVATGPGDQSKLKVD